jgi:hypothetical protein
MFKAGAALASALAIAGVVAAIAMAQQPVPTVTVTASPTAVSAQPASGIPAGPTRFTITRARARLGLSVYFALLNPGVTVDELRATLERDDRTRGSQSLGLVSIQASAVLTGAETRRDVIFRLKPGLTYVMVSEPDGEGDNPPASRGISTFTTSAQSNGAADPRPDATVRMVDLRFRGATTLPRRGIVRFENFGGVPHIAVAFPLRPRVTTAQFGRALRTDNERAMGRLLAGEPLGLQTLISGGGAWDHQLVSFSRAGRYGLVCFFNEHHRLGMYRIVRVR